MLTLGSHVKGYTEIDGLANVAQLDIVVALDFVGCHADFLAVHSDTLVGRLGGRAGYGSVCNSGQLRCSARSADLDGARVLVPVHAKACQLANIAQLEIVVVVDVVAGRVHTGKANINSLSLSSVGTMVNAFAAPAVGSDVAITAAAMAVAKILLVMVRTSSLMVISCQGGA